MTIKRRDFLCLPSTIFGLTVLVTPSKAQREREGSVLATTNPLGVALAVKDNKTLITNRHTLNIQGTVTPRDRNGIMIYDTSFPQDSKLDIAIHRLQYPQYSYEPILVSPSPMQKGEDYFLNLEGQFYRVRIGDEIRAQIENHNYRFVYGTPIEAGNIFPGLSGSEILNENGKLVGILSGKKRGIIFHGRKMYQIPLLTNVGGLEELV